MVEVGRRIGVPLHGVGMPGHFLVGVSGDADTFVDPFHGGRVLDREGCREIFAGLQGGDAPFADEYLAATGPRAILLRVLNNLERSYLERGAADAVWVARLRLRFAELSPAERRRTAALLGSLGRFAEAAAVLDEVAAGLDAGKTKDAVEQEARSLRARAN
jgi:regulator of sirC expression with transglutaminase-like and TPR domain